MLFRLIIAALYLILMMNKQKALHLFLPWDYTSCHLWTRCHSVHKNVFFLVTEKQMFISLISELPVTFSSAYFITVVVKCTPVIKYKVKKTCDWVRGLINVFRRQTVYVYYILERFNTEKLLSTSTKGSPDKKQVEFKIWQVTGISVFPLCTRFILKCDNQ